MQHEQKPNKEWRTEEQSTSELLGEAGQQNIQILTEIEDIAEYSNIQIFKY